MAAILDSVLAGRDFPASTLPILWNHIGRRQVAILPVLGEPLLHAPEAARLHAALSLAASLREAQLHFHWLEARWEGACETPLVFISAPPGRDLFALTIVRLIHEHRLHAALLFHPDSPKAQYFSPVRNEWLPLTALNCDQFPVAWAELDPTGGWSAARRRRLIVGKAWLWRERRLEDPRTWSEAWAVKAGYPLSRLTDGAAEQRL